MTLSISNTPLELLEEAWRTLQRAAADTRHALHFPTLISQGNDYPEGRVVVLRKLTSETFRIYTDKRSPKVQELSQHPSCSLLFWDPRHRLQIRVKGSATVRSGTEAEQLFASFPSEQTADYRSNRPPGTPLSPEEVAAAKEPVEGHNFCLLEIEAEKMDILQLQNEGHLRLQFVKGTKGFWEGCWVVP